MAQKLDLDQGEVVRLPKPAHSAVTPLIGRTDEISGTGQELIILTEGKKGIRIIPYGSIFHDYAPQSNTPIFELPDGSVTTWEVEEEAPQPPTAAADDQTDLRTPPEKKGK